LKENLEESICKVHAKYNQLFEQIKQERMQVSPVTQLKVSSRLLIVYISTFSWLLLKRNDQYFKETTNEVMGTM